MQHWGRCWPPARCSGQVLERNTRGSPATTSRSGAAGQGGPALSARLHMLAFALTAAPHIITAVAPVCWARQPAHSPLKQGCSRHAPKPPPGHGPVEEERAVVYPHVARRRIANKVRLHRRSVNCSRQRTLRRLPHRLALPVLCTGEHVQQGGGLALTDCQREGAHAWAAVRCTSPAPVCRSDMPASRPAMPRLPSAACRVPTTSSPASEKFLGSLGTDEAGSGSPCWGSDQVPPFGRTSMNSRWSSRRLRERRSFALSASVTRGAGSYLHARDARQSGPQNGCGTGCLGVLHQAGRCRQMRLRRQATGPACLRRGKARATRGRATHRGPAPSASSLSLASMNSDGSCFMYLARTDCGKQRRQRGGGRELLRLCVVGCHA